MAEFYFRYKKEKQINHQKLEQEKQTNKKTNKQKKTSVFKPCEVKLLMTKDKICRILLKSIIQ